MQRGCESYAATKGLYTRDSDAFDDRVSATVLFDVCRPYPSDTWTWCTSWNICVGYANDFRSCDRNPHIPVYGKFATLISPHVPNAKIIKITACTAQTPQKNEEFSRLFGDILLNSFWGLGVQVGTYALVMLTISVVATAIRIYAQNELSKMSPNKRENSSFFWGVWAVQAVILIILALGR